MTSDYVDYYIDDKGDLYLKYFLIDDSFNSRGWSVDAQIIPNLARNAVGKPFTDYEDFPDTLYNDGHPWNPQPGANLGQHIEYAKNQAAGYIVDFSPISRNALKSASGLDIERHNGYYATVKVTDPVKKALYTKNPDRIPKVSPGIIDFDNTPPETAKNTKLKNVDLAHLAGVPLGAYGDKARLYAKCSGGYECVNHLKGASNDQNNHSSLGNSDPKNPNLMSINETNTNNPNAEVTAQNQVTAAANVQAQTGNNDKQQVTETNGKVENNNNSSQPTATNNAPVKQNPAIERLKEKSFNWKDDPEYKQLLKEHEELKAKSELAEKKQTYFEIIPRDLFILNGKFDKEGYNKEIDKAVQKNLDPEYAKELYSLKLKNAQLNNKIGGKPYGASSNNANQYETPSNVPDDSLKGASDQQNGNSSQFQSLRNILQMVRLSGSDY